ncbi:MAG: hypothetical protein M1833_002206 [Piccolia ochrophora]|nr:MAG: hypothetical protein M1833_002206 [Piccolia ochrophora]
MTETFFGSDTLTLGTKSLKTRGKFERDVFVVIDFHPGDPQANPVVERYSANVMVVFAPSLQDPQLLVHMVRGWKPGSDHNPYTIRIYSWGHDVYSYPDGILQRVSFEGAERVVGKAGTSTLSNDEIFSIRSRRGAATDALNSPEVPLWSGYHVWGKQYGDSAYVQDANSYAERLIQLAGVSLEATTEGKYLSEFLNEGKTWSDLRAPRDGNNGVLKIASLDYQVRKSKSQLETTFYKLAISTGNVEIVYVDYRDEAWPGTVHYVSERPKYTGRPFPDPHDSGIRLSLPDHEPLASASKPLLPMGRVASSPMI